MSDDKSTGNNEDKDLDKQFEEWLKEQKRVQRITIENIKNNIWWDVCKNMDD
jgi:hypothetical protein